MNNKQLRTLESITRSLALLHDPKFRRPELAGLRQQLETTTKTIRQLHAEQVGNNMATGLDGAQIKLARRELRSRLLSASNHAIVTLEGLPGIDEDLRVPHANAKHEDLLQATERIVKNLRPHLPTLRRNGMRKDAIARIQAAAKAFRDKVGNADTALARRARATSSLPAALLRGRKIVRALDLMIKLELGDDSAALEMWKPAKRIPGKIGRPRKPRKPKPD